MDTSTRIKKLTEQLSHDDARKLEQSIETLQKESSITFTVKQLADQLIEIECRQDENRSGNYATEAALIKRTEQLFKKHFPHSKLVVVPVTYRPSPSTAVTPAWLEQKMNEKGIRIKQIAFDTGVDRESISEWVTGKRKMSQIVKAMFYYYLASK